MDLQERLQAVQAEHQDITQQIEEADARIAEAQRAYEEAQSHYLNGRANAQLQVRFLEGQMALLSEMMQTEALKQTQESPTTEAHAIATDLWNLQRQHEAAEKERRSQDATDGYLDWKAEKEQQPLAVLNGTQENSQPN